MIKKLLVLVPISVALVLALVVASAAFAQGTTPGTPSTPAQPGLQTQPGQTPAQPGQQTQPAKPGLGKGFLGGLGHFFGFGRFGGGQNGWAGFDALASALKLTPDQLFKQLHDGKTIEQIAQDQGVSMTDVQNAMKAANEKAFKDAVQQAVTNGRITQDQANWLLQGLQNGWLGGHGMKGGFGGMHGFDRGGKTNPANPATPNQGGTGSGTGSRFNPHGRNNGQAPSITVGQTF